MRFRRIDLRDRIATEFGVELHERSVGKLLRRLDFRPLSVRPLHPQSDPEAQETFKKLPSPSQGGARRARFWQAGRGLVPGRSKSWPARHVDLHLDQARRPPACATRPAFYLGVSVRRRCPARGVGAALVLPTVNTEGMTMHLAEIGKCVTAGAIALLIVDGAGWHSSPKLAVPENIVLLKLPPYAAELNPAENIWEYLRGNALSHQIWETYEDIVNACCNAWNSLMRTPEILRSIATRNWAQVST